MRIKLTTAESEAVERAYYEAHSIESIMGVLSRQLKEDGNEQTAKILTHYAEQCKVAHMKLQMAQDRILERYGLDSPGKRYRFDFSREEVREDDTET